MGEERPGMLDWRCERENPPQSLKEERLACTSGAAAPSLALPFGGNL